MKKFSVKRLGVLAVAVAAMAALSVTTASACTTIYAGSQLTQEGASVLARSEDYGSDMNKLWYISEAGAYSGTYRGCPAYGPFVYELSKPSYQFTCFKNDDVYDGICPECGEENAAHVSYSEFGTNEKGVSVSATETIFGNEAVLELDPYRGARWAQETGKCAGIEETDIPTILLSEAATAREALELLLDIYDSYGCAGGAGLFITDKNESWYVENCSGTQYVAIRLPEDLLFLEPNMAVIGRIDLDDSETVIASAALIETAQKAGTFVGDAEKNIIDFRASYASLGDSVDKRLVEGLNYLNSSYQYTNEQLTADNSLFTISNLDENDSLVSLYTNIQADRTLTMDDILNYYKLSTIAKSGNQDIEIFQIFRDRPEACATVGWVAMGDLACNVFVPCYPMLLTGMYEGYQVGTPQVQFTTEQPEDGLYYPYTKRAYDPETWEFTLIDGYRLLPEGWEQSYYWCFEVLNDYVRYFENSDGTPLVSQTDAAYVKARLKELQQQFYGEFLTAAQLQSAASPEKLATENAKAMAAQAQSLALELIGYLDGSAQLTRAGVIYSLWQAQGAPAAKCGTMPFTDVDSDAYYYDALLWAVEKGIAAGIGGARFAPDAVCTRAQAAVLAYRAAGAPEMEPWGFSDVPAGSYYAAAAAWSGRIGAVSGTDFTPDTPCTRAQLNSLLAALEEA